MKLKSSFQDHLHASERRRLRKCLKADFRFEEWVSPSPNRVYDFIQQNRRLLGYSLSFSVAQLEQWLLIFQKHTAFLCQRPRYDCLAYVGRACR
ncbi:MAG: hypothetical protein R2822_25795 [Spirosomataceae bacterium]